MRNVCAQVSKEEAEERIRAIKEPYKLEILEGIAARHPDDPITIYHLGKQGGEGEHWWDLCAGPHVETTKDLNPAAMDLESLAGEPLIAYQQVDEAQAMHSYGSATCHTLQFLLPQTIGMVTSAHDVICFGVYSYNTVDDVPVLLFVSWPNLFVEKRNFPNKNADKGQFCGGSSVMRIACCHSSVAITSCHACDPAGAYWRGDETKAQLQRIYGTAWETKEQLKAYQQLKVEAARRSASPLPLQSSWMRVLSHFLHTSRARCTVTAM